MVHYTVGMEHGSQGSSDWVQNGLSLLVIVLCMLDWVEACTVSFMGALFVFPNDLFFFPFILCCLRYFLFVIHFESASFIRCPLWTLVIHLSVRFFLNKTLLDDGSGFGCDSSAVVNILAHRDATQRSFIQQEYRAMYSEELTTRLSKELSGDLKVLYLLLN